MYVTETTQPLETELEWKSRADREGEFALLLCLGAHASPKAYMYMAVIFVSCTCLYVCS